MRGVISFVALAVMPTLHAFLIPTPGLARQRGIIAMSAGDLLPSKEPGVEVRK